jgi:hypothetical protein
MDRDVLVHQMTERFQELYNRALDALDQAPDGQWIAASEWAFRDAFLQLMKESYQAGLQSKVDAHPTAQAAAFPPPNPALADQPPLRNKGEPPIHVLTIGGEIELNRRYFWSKSAGGVFPVDALIGITLSKASPAAREACSTMGVMQDFAQGVEDLRRLTGLRISKERLRQITESEGVAVTALRGDGTLPPSWSATQATTTLGGPTRVYVGVDGVMARTVTQTEKDKRRKDHAIRRQQRGKAGVGNLQPLSRAKAGSDECFKEMKIGLFYDQSKTRKHVFATQGNHERFGELLRGHADALGLEQAVETLSLTDGGPWIRNQLVKHLKKLQAMLLDFYHLSEHVWDTARACWGDGEEGRAWARQQLHDIKHIGGRPVLAAIAEAKKKLRATAKQDALRLLRNYIVERWEMVEYPAALAKGWDIGSGPTEAMCKNLTLRLKRPGMKWDTDNAAALMNLVALREGGQWELYWQNRKTA